MKNDESLTLRCLVYRERLTIWFTDELNEIDSEFNVSMANDDYLKRYGLRFSFLNIVREFFKNLQGWYKPVIIPPSRIIEAETQIDMNQVTSPFGQGITNRLFFLKNQDLASDDFKIYQKIHKAFYEITGYDFNIFPSQENKITLCYKEKDKEWVCADACGLGLSDLLIILTYVVDFEYTFICIEEPETHVHPDIQRKLLSFLKSIKSKQFIISTHSSVFLNPSMVDKIYYTSFENNVSVSDETNKSEILNALGYSVSDNLVSDLIILTEGPTDHPVISHILQLIGVDEKYNVKMWALGGDIMGELDLAVFAERNNVIALIDKDPGSSKARTRFKKNCEKHGVKVHQLKRYSIENYFKLEAIRKVYPDLIPTTVKELDHNIKVDEQIKFSSMGRSIKAKNLDIVKEMTVQDFIGTDLYKFCLDIKKMVEYGEGTYSNS